MKLFNRELTIVETIGVARVMQQEKKCGGCLLVECSNDLVEEITRLKAELLVMSQAENKWIPVSERLPSDVEDVLCQNKDEGIVVDYYTNIGFNYDVVAWQPLPKPYKEEHNDS